MEAIVDDEEEIDAVRTHVQRRARMRSMLAELDGAIAEAEAAVATLPPEAEAEGAAACNVSVVIGTSEMARTEPELVGKISAMINAAYFEANRDLLPDGATTYQRVDEDDVLDRLRMGDAGARANRVLHLAYRESQLVGACSSTYQPPWTPEGCGHWGILSVHPSAAGTGVASALVRAAERRLAGACRRVQIEYEYTRGHAHSERLMKIYEGRYGFSCDAPTSRRRRRGSQTDAEELQEGETQFRRCRKDLPARWTVQERPVHLRAIRDSIGAEMADEAPVRQPGTISRVGHDFSLGGLVGLEHLNGRRVGVLLYEPDKESYVALVRRRAGADEDDDDDDAGTLVRVAAHFLTDDDPAGSDDAIEAAGGAAASGEAADETVAGEAVALS